MKRILVTAAILSLGAGTAGVSLAGTADGQGAQKRTLFEVTNDNMTDTSQCKSSEDTDSAHVGAASGWVILNAPGKSGATERVTGEVALKKAQPNGDFLVFLAQDGNCVPAGELTTNGQGNGNAHVDQPAMGGTYYVVLQNLDMSERYASSPVLLR